MKLGSQTGSMVNHLYSRMVLNAPKVKVGDGATLLSWTDRHAGTVIEVLEKKGDVAFIRVQMDNAKRIDGNGFSENQEYEYTPNLEGPIYVFKREKDGRWSECSKNTVTGRWNKRDGHGLRVGVRESYHDFSF
jgi:hypothetical protein